ncbi:MAG: cupin domain-containing protein [Bacteroidales bacterium]
MTAQQLIEHFSLQQHPEGGWYKQIYEAKGIISLETLPPKFNNDKSYATSILYLLKKGEISLFHKLKQDELWHFYYGDTLILHTISKNGEYLQVRLGTNFLNGEHPFYAIEAGTILAAELAKNSEFALSGCTVTPGFEFSDMTIMRKSELLEKFPTLKDLIEKFGA